MLVINARVDMPIALVADVLISKLSGTTVDVDVGVVVDVKTVLMTCALIDIELVMMLSYIVEVKSDDWHEAGIDIDISVDRRVGEWIDALARV